MGVKVESTLKKGIEFHKAGHIEEAKKLYTAILEVIPGHPDANHNMGALAFGIGDFKASLSFFKTALAVKSTKAQFWISYIDALIHLKKIGDAKAIFAEAKQKGITGKAFTELEQRLYKAQQDVGSGSKNQDPPRDKLQNLFNLYTHGKLQKALDDSKELLHEFPNSAILYYINGTVNVGLQLFNEGMNSFKKALKIKPDYVEVYNNMGIAFKDQGDQEKAIKSFKQVIKINPNFYEAYNNMGIALKDQGDQEKAMKSFKQAIKIKPDFYEAHNNMGIVLKEQGDQEKAIKSFKKAIEIKPDFYEAYNNLGVVLKDQGYQEKAIDNYEHAVKIKPDYVEAYYNIGNAFKTLGKLEEAIAAYNKAVSIDPDYVKAYNNLGNSLRERGKLEDSIDAFNKALTINPDYAETHNNMGITLQEMGKLQEAIEAYNKAVLINPKYAEGYNNMGNTFRNQEKLEESIGAYSKALSINPDYADAYNNMGNSLREIGKLEEAIEAYNKALSIKHDYADIHWNLALINHLRGNLIDGCELYEYRLKKEEITVRPARTRFKWDGKQSLRGKHFLVYEEQGLGDAIQFCRYLPLLEEKGAKVSFKVKSKLHQLLGTLKTKADFLSEMPSDGMIDFESPLLSLPYLFGTTLSTIPGKSPYLYAQEDMSKTWKKTLSEDTFKIGICWQGSKRPLDIGRSFPLSLFEGISKIPTVELINLHKGEGNKQLEEISFLLTTLGSQFDSGPDSFIDTAAVMMSCDLIITSDTAVAHLAGALGRQTWVVLKYIPDWRWMLDRTDSPWYPTMKLYRQKIRGEWIDIFKKMEKNLRDLLKKTNTRSDSGAAPTIGI